MDIDIEVTGGETYALPVASITSDTLIIQGCVYLRGWSLRDAQSNQPVEASGNSVAPGAGAAIAATGNLPAGTYTVAWTVGLQGAAAAADANNFQLVDSAGVVLASVNPGVAGEFPQQQVQVSIAQNTAISVEAIGAGTANVTYSADISATPTGDVETVVEIQDGSKPIAEVGFLSGRSEQGDYGRPGILIETGLNIHVISGTVTGAVHVAYDKP